MRTHKIVKVEWEDSTNSPGWRDYNKRKDTEPSTCYSAGILVRTKRGSIGVAHSICPESKDIADTIIIPRKVIKKIEVLSTFRR